MLFLRLPASPVALRFRLRAYSSAWLERFPDKEEVSGSSPLRPTISTLSLLRYGDLAQLVEHLLCKQGVRGSIPLVSTKWNPQNGLHKNYSTQINF